MQISVSRTSKVRVLNSIKKIQQTRKIKPKTTTLYPQQTEISPH